MIVGEVTGLKRLFWARADILAVENAPAEVRPGTLFWIDVTLRNETAFPMCSAPPFPIQLSYHWRHAATE
jgi:hypothetical protein